MDLANYSPHSVATMEFGQYSTELMNLAIALTFFSKQQQTPLPIS